MKQDPPLKFSPFSGTLSLRTKSGCCLLRGDEAMNGKQSRFKIKASDGVFLKLTRNLIIFSLLAAFFLTFENSYREEARLKRELTDWGAQVARGMGEKTPSCADSYELGRIREHFSALKRIYPPLRAVRFIDLDNEGNPLLRVCSESWDKDAPALSLPLPEELRTAAARAARERKAGVVMPYGPRRGKGIAVFAPLGHGLYSGMEAALLLDLDPSLVSERIWKAASLPWRQWRPSVFWQSSGELF